MASHYELESAACELISGQESAPNYYRFEVSPMSGEMYVTGQEEYMHLPKWIGGVAFANNVRTDHLEIDRLSSIIQQTATRVYQ